MTDHTEETGPIPPYLPEEPPVSETTDAPDRFRSFVNTVFDYAELVVITVCVILFATLFLFRHAVVDGDSMNRTLSNGEHLIISDFLYTPESGDIVVFEDPDTTGLRKPLIKRVIATEGQTVTISADGVSVDGKRLTEPYAYLGGSPYGARDYVSYGLANGLKPSSDGVFTYRVGENEVFVMGDNRFNSMDGRMFGPIPVDSILGKVLIRVAPFSEFGGVD